MSNFLKEVGQPIVYKVIHPLIGLLHKTGVTPNMITLIGFALNIVVAAIFIIGAHRMPGDLTVVGWGGAAVLFAGLFDMIDGRLARVSGQESTFGALFDSVLDRYSELVMFLGICYYFMREGYLVSALLAFIAMIGSIMVSYVRARAEGLGIDCKGGLMQRPERILTIGISAVICGISAADLGSYRVISKDGWVLFEAAYLFTIPMFLLAVLTNWTAIQRINDAKKSLEQRS